ncbi:CgeB family protein [Butyrivibrio sp. MC2021]|uniref:CgeB family protein n=1 Tax=Butyrivibrio sp. MC2021 TaxID=1408306 RepID=UPI00047B5BB7|nr:DUF3880 domain-containing protein [Butyrivibrio sp. MC2021]
MKILFLDWNSYGNLDILSAIEELKASGRDIHIELYPYDNHIERDDKQFAEKFKTDLQKKSPDFVMSFNFFPIVSGVCNEVGIKYVSWVYDNPAINLYSFTLINPCNYVFLFDSQMYEVFANQGIKTVYYLPMAAAVERYDRFEKSDVFRKKWGGELAFVGNLYTEGHNYYDQIEDKLSDYSKGYINGLMRAQMEINGASIVEGSIPENVMKEMVDALDAKPNYDGVETYDYIYSNYVIDRKITALERTEMLTMIGEKYSVNLFTGDKNFKPKGINNRGKVDYYKEMPYIFKNTDINLNITLRSIQRGIPLRCMDIMGCGGFLLTNYQEDFLHFFEPFEDYVYFESRKDLMDKIEYYLTHEEERNRIAKSGYEKIKANHTYRLRLEEILDIVGN